MTVLTDFKARFIDFDTALADKWVPIYENIWPCYYGGNYNFSCDKQIALNIIAHLITDGDEGGSDGLQQVGSQAAGSVSQTFKTQDKINQRDAYWGSTIYGRAVLQLTSYRLGGLFV